jgi:transcriptional regulator with XRE-family HTH domain
MTNHTHNLPPNILGFWIRMVRTAANLSQDALAAAAGVTERTVQRIEAGENISVQSRRSLARGLGYDDPNIFDDSAFIATVSGLVESLRAEAIRAEQDRYPDHLKIEATATVSGADLANLIEAADASIFQCDEGASDDTRIEAATLFDNLRDWGDLWSELSYSDKLKAQKSFSAALNSLSKHSLRGYQARRVGRLVGGAPAGRAPIPFTVVYFALVPDDQELTYLLVPKRA